MDANVVCEFLKQAIQALKEVIPLENHTWEDTLIERYDGGIAMNISTKPDFSRFIMRAVSKETNFIENFKTLLWEDQEIKNRGINAKINNYNDIVIPNMISFQLLNDYLSQLKQLNYDNEIALKTANNFLGSLDSGYSKATFYTILRGLETDFETYKFTDGCRIRRLKDVEMAAFIDQDKSLFDDEAILYHPCIVEYSCNLKIAENPPFEVITNRFNRIMTALRLIKEGHIEYQDIRLRTENIGEILQQRSKSGNWRVRLSAFGITTYHLVTDDLPELDQLLFGLEKLTDNNPLHAAINRMNLASERQRPADQLVDLMISAETLFGGKSRSEISFRVYMRCAKFLGKTLVERQEIMRFLKNAYDIRSAIVHGDNIETKEKTIHEIVRQLEQYVRQSIKLLLEQILVNSQFKFDDTYFNDLLLS